MIIIIIIILFMSACSERVNDKKTIVHSFLLIVSKLIRTIVVFSDNVRLYTAVSSKLMTVTCTCYGVRNRPPDIIHARTLTSATRYEINGFQSYLVVARRYVLFVFLSGANSILIDAVLPATPHPSPRYSERDKLQECVFSFRLLFLLGHPLFTWKDNLRRYKPAT